LKSTKKTGECCELKPVKHPTIHDEHRQTPEISYKDVKGFWFKPTSGALPDRSDFAVNKLTVDNPLPVPLSKRFKPSKKMDEQVYNDENYNWGQMNMIKR
jgi:hypothetical protein